MLVKPSMHIYIKTCLCSLFISIPFDDSMQRISYLTRDCRERDHGILPEEGGKLGQTSAALRQRFAMPNAWQGNCLACWKVRALQRHLPGCCPTIQGSKLDLHHSAPQTLACLFVVDRLSGFVTRLSPSAVMLTRLGCQSSLEITG